MFYDDFAEVLDKTFTVIRQTQTLDPATNRPIKSKTTFGPYKCYLNRKTVATSKNSDRTILTEQLRIYTGAEVNVKFGDLIVIDNVQYNAGFVYKPLNDHAEIDIKALDEK